MEYAIIWRICQINCLPESGRPATGFSRYNGPMDWFTLLQSLAIVLGLLFNAHALWADTRSRRIANLFLLTSNHRELWERLFDSPELSRVQSLAADLKTEPVTAPEALFARLLILHLNSAYH